MKRELLSIVLLTNILMYGFAQSVINYKVEKAENDQLLLCKINDIVYKIDIKKPSEDGYKTWVLNETEYKEKLDNKSVEILPSFNFIYEDEFNSIECKALVDSIGEYAFANTGIICISLPPTIKKIGSCAFMGTNQLKGIKIPEGVEKIYDHCFSNSGIEKIYLYANTILDRFIFYGCDSLKTIYIQVVDGIAFPVKWELFDKQAFWKRGYDTNERFTIKVEDTTKYYENVEKEENSPWKYVKIEHWETTD